MHPLDSTDLVASTCIESMAEGMIVWDLEARAHSCNPAARRILNLTDDTLVGRSWHELVRDLVDRHRQPFPVTHVQATLSTGLPHDGMLGVVRLDAVPLTLREACRPLHRDGVVVGAVTTFVDLTELTDTAARLDELIDRSNIGTWEKNFVTGAAKRNETYYRLLGLPREGLETTFEALAARAHPDDVAVFASVPAHWPTGTPYALEARLRTGSGEFKWFEVRGCSQLDSRGQPIRAFGVLVDIDEPKRLELARIAALTEHIRHLEELLPICMYCKSIRDGDAWTRPEVFFARTASFSHGICPDCFSKHHPGD